MNMHTLEYKITCTPKSQVEMCHLYLVVGKFNVRRIRDILHESIIAIEQIALNVHRRKLWFYKIIRQPNIHNFTIQVNKVTQKILFTSPQEYALQAQH